MDADLQLSASRSLRRRRRSARSAGPHAVARRTLFMFTAECRGTQGVDDIVKTRTGQVLVVDTPAPGVGWP
jgi:hypothetical protein